jgi:hypothetical protein
MVLHRFIDTHGHRQSSTELIVMSGQLFRPASYDPLYTVILTELRNRVRICELQFNIDGHKGEYKGNFWPDLN